MTKRKDDVELICSIAELSSMFEESRSLDEFLDAVVRTVAGHMRADVCSVYLLDDPSGDLVLRATYGLNPESVGVVRLKVGEGLCGVALKELRPIREAVASRNPHFKYIPNSFEEKYEAFLVVPILRGLKPIGVLVVQDEQAGSFQNEDGRALQAIASQLSGTIENARLLLSLREMDRTHPGRKRGTHNLYEGRAVSSGLAYGPATVWALRGSSGNRLDRPEPSGAGLAEFLDALRRSEYQVLELQRKTAELFGDEVSMIFSAQQLLLRDDQLEGEMIERIKAGDDAAVAIVDVLNGYIDRFAASDMEMLREKVHDLKDLGHRLLENLSDREDDAGANYQGHIVISADLLPSDVVKLVAQHAGGLVMVGGGMNSHASILARGLDIPLLIIENDDVLNVVEESDVLLDCLKGRLLVEPDEDVRASYESMLETRGPQRQKARYAETHTRDGTQVRLLANINLMGEVPMAWEYGAEGVGLYRSEFPFLIRNDFPSEEEQFRVYRGILDACDQRDVVFRTLDIGADKYLSYVPAWNEANPALGLRSIRFSLKNREVFGEQLRALLRAGEGRVLKIMFPLVSSLEELRTARSCVETAIRELKEAGMGCNDAPELGIMIECPAAVALAGALAQEADFFSIGTNDLVQYLLAVDRTNEHVADLYIDHHPVVFRALKRVIDAAKTAGIPVSVCGEMAANKWALPVLVGMGLRALSIEPRSIGQVQAAIMQIELAEAQALAARVLEVDTIAETLTLLEGGIPTANSERVREDTDG